ncbi:hypothetical protein RchiOBHm_Chr5g0007271 [Rosa chinensis]|uniref:Uncharacterized protein n=1 Tax=Rosa chinensis TaxID=74649 RepID=A0A2P6Q3V3_ROSCH|nr:hypothetical protein RchiOBHm_Chr5g0007271 [Rosa chinensis]
MIITSVQDSNVSSFNQCSPSFSSTHLILAKLEPTLLFSDFLNIYIYIYIYIFVFPYTHILVCLLTLLLTSSFGYSGLKPAGTWEVDGTGSITWVIIDATQGSELGKIILVYVLDAIIRVDHERYFLDQLQSRGFPMIMSYEHQQVSGACLIN